MMLLAALLIAADPGPALPAVSASFNPRAGEFVESDPTIKQWALRIYDGNHDGWLTLYEAQPAVAAFREVSTMRKSQVSMMVWTASRSMGFVR